MDSIFISFLQRLLLLTPVLLACVAGIIAALVFWQRHPRAAILTLISSVLLLVTTLASQFLVLYVVQARNSFGWNVQQSFWIISAITTIASVIQAIVYGLILASVFMNRKESSYN